MLTYEIAPRLNHIILFSRYYPDPLNMDRSILNWIGEFNTMDEAILKLIQLTTNNK